MMFMVNSSIGTTAMHLSNGDNADHICVPRSRRGVLFVLGEFEGGYGSFRISRADFPVFSNEKSGWVCIGDPKAAANAVEFINNCIAVIDTQGEFKGLWLNVKNNE